jgi:Zn-dependent peptidase ImmA (M78 family)
MTSIYTPEIEKQLIQDYKDGVPVKELALRLGVPDRSVIAKLSSLGLYQKKVYLSKTGQVPIKKEEYIEKLAKVLNVNIDRLESLEKANKSVLSMLLTALSADK